MQNKLTQLLGITYPIIQGGMMGISLAELTSAVSNAGGLGTLGQTGDTAVWHDEIKKTKHMTDKPFAVNLPLHIGDLEKKVRVICDEKVQIVFTAAGNPSRVIGPLKEAGVKVLQVVASTEHAVKAEAAGVDGVVAEGGESGGMVAKNRVSTMVLVPLVVDAVNIPVVAAGGIGDARGLVAALALGALGVQMGTVFEASEECNVPRELKEGIIRAKETDTCVTPMGIAQSRRIREAVCPNSFGAGQIVGMVKKIERAGDIVARIAMETEEILGRLGMVKF